MPSDSGMLFVDMGESVESRLAFDCDCDIKCEFEFENVLYGLVLVFE
jgi:hypothetical protein